MTLRQKLLEANEVWLGHMGHSDDQSCLAALGALRSSTELARHRGYTFSMFVYIYTSTIAVNIYPLIRVLRGTQLDSLKGHL